MVAMKLCVFVSCLAVAEAYGSSVAESMKVKSRAEIMAQMTSATALDTVLNMSRVNKKHELVALIETKFGLKADGDNYADESEMNRRVMKGRRTMASLQTALRGSGKEEPRGYSAVAGATKMLNEMSTQTLLDLELEESRCDTEKDDATRNMNLLRNSVTTYNSDAAGARGRVLDAQGQIQTFEVNLQHNEEELKQHQIDCQREIAALTYELTIVTGDVAVMKTVLSLIDCGSAQASGTFMLVQCKGCKNSMMIKHHRIQSLLNGLKSEAVKQEVEKKLSAVYDSMADDEEPTAIAFIETGMQAVMNVATDTTTPFFNASVVLNISDVPVPPAPVDCQATDKCTLASSPNCQKLKDKFIAVQAGIVDKETELKTELGQKETWCEEQENYFVTLIDQLNAKLSTQRANLATATEDQNTAESGSHSASQQHAAAAAEFTKNMKECCDNQNTFKSELCALGKIRGELNNMNGTKIYITDCELSDWSKEECSHTCGGGRVKSTRSILTHPIGDGIPCGSLVKEEACNTHACPVNCELAEWSQWSECGAQCGGGVKERTRGKLQEAMNGGEPCGSMEEVEACNAQACNVDCQLSEWTEWTECSMACDGGTQRRTKSIAEPAVGTGKCWEVDAIERLQFKDCNIRSCRDALIEDNATLFDCKSFVDVQFLMDGSASLGYYGWALENKVVEAMMTQMDGGVGNAMISLELFSGPTSWEDYEACTEGSNDVDLEGQCGMKQISHMTSDIDGVKRLLRQTPFPRKSTLTSVALGLAEQEIKYGRAGAAPVVVVVTDGEPISVMQTVDAAHRLQSVAKVIWVAIGGDAPVEMIEQVAQLPKHEHIIHVGSFYDLRETEAFNSLINEVVTKVCPKAGSPCVLEPTSCACSLHRDANFCSTSEAGRCMELCPNAEPIMAGPPRGGQMIY